MKNREVSKMKFRQYGYTEKKIEVREMSMGSIVLTAGQALVNAGMTDIEIRIIDCTSGDVDKWAGVKGIMRHDWCADYRVNVYSMCIMHDNKENYDYMKIVISDDIEW